MRRLTLALALTAFALPAMAQDQLIGPLIMTTMTGNTVQGSMADGVVYAEYYDPDGTIRADEYTGTWSIDVDEMCFDYGSDPVPCFEVARQGKQISWIIDGAVVGTGTLVKGNPNGF